MSPSQPSGQALRVGFGRVDITPTESVPLAGAGNTSSRMSVGVLCPLLCTCIAFTDSQMRTILLFHNDLIRSNKTLSQKIRQTVSTQTGIPYASIILAGTHTHNAPDPDNLAEPSILRYRDAMVKWSCEAAKLALADRQEATASIGCADPKGLNFVRHYKTAAGIVVGDNFGTWVDSPCVAHTHDADTRMQLIRFHREGAKDIVLVNWQVHPHRSSSKRCGHHYEISADIVGTMRDRFEAETGCLFAYFTGASGNVNPTSRIPEENITSDYMEQGHAMADYAIGALSSMSPVSTGNVQILPHVYAGKTDRSGEGKLEEAKIVADHWVKHNDLKEAVRLAQSHGINSPYHAQGIIMKATLPETLDVEMYAFSIGDIGFIAAPYEMFDENGRTVKDESPFAMTFIVTCANDALGYIPSLEGFRNNCYGANTGRFAPGTGEALAQEYLQMLHKIWPTH